MLRLNRIQPCRTRAGTLATALLISGFLFAPEALAAKKHHKGKKSSLFKSRFFKNITPKYSYSYIDLDFNSQANENYNTFHGFSNAYSVGIDNLRFNRKTSAGIYFFQIDSRTSSSVRLMPNDPSYSNSSTAINALFAHVSRKINRKLMVDFMGSLGQSKNSSLSNTEKEEGLDPGLTNKTNQTYLLGTTGTYSKRKKKLEFRMSAGALFNMVNSGVGYTYHLEPRAPQAGRPLVTKTGILFEGVKLSYRLDKKFIPYVSGGLVQVPYYSNSRPVINAAAILGPIPQLLMNQNAYRLAAGFTINRKSFSLKIDQRYYNSVNTLITHTTSATLTTRFN